MQCKLTILRFCIISICKKPLVEPARRFCREGVFKSGNDQKPVKVFLFNDLVLITAEKNFAFMRGSGLEYKASYLLHTSRLVVVADTDGIKIYAKTGTYQKLIALNTKQ